MKKIFRGQVILSAVYTVTAIVVFLYTLVFMTEYNDLFGLKMPQNKQIAQFYEVILQGFNRQILVWAIVGIIGILMIVLLEIRTAVPDRFAAAVMTVYMGCCCFGAVNAIRNILAIWAYYKGLDFQYLYADGITGYELKFTTFQVGIGIYSVQIIVCVAFAAVLLLTMFVLHPVFLALSLLGALGYCAQLRGWRSLWRTLGRLVPFLALMAALNALFNHAGVTMLFYLPNGNPVTREALCYGAAAAAMFARQ